MAIKAAALTIVLSLGATQAMAQPGYYYGGEPPPAYDVGPMQGLSMRQVTRVVRSAGLRPIAQPRRVGRNYIVSSVDRHGVVKRVVIDARMGEIVAVRAARGPIGGWGRADHFGGPPRPEVGLDNDVTVLGPDAGPGDAYGAPSRPHTRGPGARSPAKADQNKAPQKKDAVASVPPPSAPAAAEKAPPHEPDTESLPKADGAVTLPSSQAEQAVKPEQAAKPEATASVPNEPAAAAPDAPKAAPAKRPAGTRSATVTPAKPPLPVRRPAAAQPAVAKPGDSAKEAPPASSPRVVLPGGPATKDETTASASSGKPQNAEPKVAPTPPATTIVPAQSYE